MKRFTIAFFITAVTLMGSGCSTMAPQYSASMDNVQTLKNNGDYATKVGSFDSTPDPKNANPISLRGSSMSSPYQNSYSAYIAEAIKQELSMAKKMSTDASTEISGTLLKNDVDVSGFSTGKTDIQARFVVKKSSEVRYDKIKTVHYEFPSSFVGATAIPNGINSYPVAVQKLLADLYADPEFITALK